jgi:hypothetical protein
LELHLELGADRRHVGPQVYPPAEIPVLRVQVVEYLSGCGLGGLELLNPLPLGDRIE